MTTQQKWSMNLLVLAFLVCAMGSVLVLTPVAAVAAGESQELVGRDGCLACHEGYLADTVHGRLPKKMYDEGKMECESCHGNGNAHVEAEGDTEKITRRPNADAVRAMCFQCHPRDRSMSGDWKRGVHMTRAESDCLTCHDFHSSKNAAMLRKGVTETCLECHPQIKAEFARPWHHPLDEGGVTCASCHDPHTEKKGIGRYGERNEICTKCHTEVKGPFMWEHKATTDEEGCLNCHQPHGASSRKLLNQPDNALCLKCHQGMFGTGKSVPTAGFSKASIEHSRNPLYLNRCATCHGTPFNPVVGVGHFNLVPGECANCHADFAGIDHTKFLTKGRCTDCHTDIHGSNHSRGFLE